MNPSSNSAHKRRVSAHFTQRPLQVRILRFYVQLQARNPTVSVCEFTVEPRRETNNSHSANAQMFKAKEPRIKNSTQAQGAHAKIRGIKPLTFWLRADSSNQDVIKTYTFPLSLHLRVTFPSKSFQRTVIKPLLSPLPSSSAPVAC